MGLLDKFRQKKQDIKEDDTAIKALEYRVESVERRVDLLEGRAKVVLQTYKRGKNGHRQPA